MNNGEKIRARRKELGLTQQELAEKIGYKTKTSVCKIESGFCGIDQETIERLSKALYVPVDFFFDEDELEETKQDVIFRKRKVLFDLSAKASEEDLDKFIKMLEVFTDEK